LATPRIYLTGPVSIEHGDRLVSEAHLPGRQGRLAFVFLIAARDRPIGRDELARALWSDEQPAERDASLNPILSKLRVVLKKAGWAVNEAAFDVRSGAIHVRLPSHTWIDIEEAANAIDEAEGALRRQNPARAWGFANVVVSIARRPFLVDQEAPWIEARRAALGRLQMRGLDCLAAASEATGDAASAVQYTTEVLELDPFRETAYQRLMRLHAAAGNRAEALRLYERYRRLMRDELGASPSPSTESVFLDILRGG
jgi:DNA-binding SARP family transcriptional activator